MTLPKLNISCSSCSMILHVSLFTVHEMKHLPYLGHWQDDTKYVSSGGGWIWYNCHSKHNSIIISYSCVLLGDSWCSSWTFHPLGIISSCKVPLTGPISVEYCWPLSAYPFTRNHLFLLHGVSKTAWILLNNAGPPPSTSNYPFICQGAFNMASTAVHEPSAKYYQLSSLHRRRWRKRRRIGIWVEDYPILPVLEVWRR